MSEKLRVTCTEHDTCRFANSRDACLSAFILPIIHDDKNDKDKDNYNYNDDMNDRDNDKNIDKYDNLMMLLGEETQGRYSGEFNLIGGKGELSDNGCLIECLRREVKEECKIDFGDLEMFDQNIKDPITGHLRVLFFHTTPVFVGNFLNLSKTSVDQINQIILQDNQDLNLPSHLKELSQVQWIKMKGDQSVMMPISDFTKQVIKYFRKLLRQRIFVI